MERIIIGTGRCGSTLLSTLMSMHPDALVLSEYLSSCHPEQGWPSSGDISGKGFSAILTRFSGIEAMYLNRNILFAEVLGDMESEKQANQEISMISTLTMAAMPFLSEDPAALLAELVDKANSQSMQSLREHFLEINQWLVDKFGKSYWIERSGMSTNMFKEIFEVFPAANYVHIYRDGGECALSMRDLIDTQIKVSYHVNPPSDEELQKSLDLSLSSEQDPIQQRIKNLPAVEHFGEFWSLGIQKFYAELPKLQAKQLLTIKYEELLQKPDEILSTVAKHFGMTVDEGWLKKAKEYIRLPLKIRVDGLSADEQVRLQKTCQPGNILLGEDKGRSPYIDGTLKLEALIRAAQ